MPVGRSQDIVVALRAAHGEVVLAPSPEETDASNARREARARENAAIALAAIEDHGTEEYRRFRARGNWGIVCLCHSRKEHRP